MVVGVAIQQRTGRSTFVSVHNPGLRIREGYNVLAEGDFGSVLGSTATTVADFVRDDSGEWTFQSDIRGFDADPATFARIMGSPQES